MDGLIKEFLSKKKMVDIDTLKEGDILSESSHYIVIKKMWDRVKLKHNESGDEVKIGNSYLTKYLKSADQYDKTIKVTKEDKPDGTLGIRSIFERINADTVFTVCFKKQDKPRSKKSIDADIEEKLNKFLLAIERAKTQKKSISDVAKKHFSDLILNPILGFEEGEDRVLRGYKVQFESRDGRYDCVDMDIIKTDKESGIRPININTIKWLIYDGVKYVVDK
jgi:hypothetical protein